MLLNYIRLTLRTLLKKKYFTLTNLLGLTICFVCYFVINAYVNSELSYDKYLPDYDRIYRVEVKYNPATLPRTPYPMAAALVKDFPEVESAVSITPIWNRGLVKKDLVIELGNKSFIEKNILAVDTTFFSVFNFGVVAGDVNKTLNNSAAIIVTESTAKKYFGTVDVVGKMVLVDGQHNMLIGAVINDVPYCSHIKFDLLISYTTLKKVSGSDFFTWADFGHYNYIKIKEGANIEELIKKIPEWTTKYIDYTVPDLKTVNDLAHKFTLTPITKIHLSSFSTWELSAGGNIFYIYILYSAAIILVIIGAINFTNLSIAYSIQRAKEVGIRKTLGATKNQIIAQFLGETYSITLISVIIAYIISIVILKNPSLELQSSLKYFNYFSYWQLMIVLLLIIFVGGISGFYPALYLSSLNTTNIFRTQNLFFSPGKINKGLILFQIVASTLLLIMTFGMNKQLDFIKNRNLGFNKENIIVIPLYDDLAKEKNEVIKQDLMKNKSIVNAACTSNIPGDMYDKNSVEIFNTNETLSINEIYVDEDYYKTMGIKIKSGSTFAKGKSSNRYFLINAQAEELLGKSDILGKTIEWYPGDERITGEIIGITDDYNFRSLKYKIEPMLFIRGNSYEFNYMLIKTSSFNISEVIKDVKNIFSKYQNTKYFEYHILDDSMDELYRNEKVLSEVFKYFAIVSIIIAVIGVYSLLIYVLEGKKKEIGIRKVLGASTMHILVLITKKFIIGISVGILVAVLIGVYLINNWLAEFAYKVDINIIVYLFGIAIVGIIFILTVIIQGMRFASINPAGLLKYE